MNAYLLSRHFHVVGVEGGRVTGQFVAMVTGDGRVMIKPHDAIAWHDEAHGSGRILYSDTFTVAAVVAGDDVALSPRSVREPVRADVVDVWDDLLAALRAVAEQALSAQADAQLAEADS